MMKMRIALAYLAAVALAILVTGCQDGGPSAKIFVKNGAGGRLTVALLPFENVSRNADAGRIVANTVMTYLLSTGDYNVIEPGVVYSVLQSESIRLADGITPEICAKMQPKLKADVFLIGLVEDFGEVRIGADTYPSISFSARLVDARTAEILWAATISKTGADSVKIFDIGRVSSLGKLAKQAVDAMARSLSVSQPAIVTSLSSHAGTEASKQAAAPTNGATEEVKPLTFVDSETARALAQGGKSSDENASFGEPELTAPLEMTGIPEEQQYG